MKGSKSDFIWFGLRASTLEFFILAITLFVALIRISLRKMHLKVKAGNTQNQQTLHQAPETLKPQKQANWFQVI